MLYKGMKDFLGLVASKEAGTIGRSAEITKGVISDAMPFSISPRVVDMIKSTFGTPRDSTDLVEIFRGIQLPHEKTWVEMPSPFDHKLGDYGVCISATPSSIEILSVHGENGGGLFTDISVSLEGKGVSFGFVEFSHSMLSTYLFDHMKMGKDEAVETADHMLEAACRKAIDVTTIGCHALNLMSAKNSPVEMSEASTMSRQERRALERKGIVVPRQDTQYLKIDLNAVGVEHMRSLQERDAEGCARRRAHWVRGHLMRTRAKGMVWRNSHVRGFGEAVMKPREIDSSTDDLQP